MPALSLTRQEAFARGLAMGLSSRVASTQAGYAGNWKRTRTRASRPHIGARVAALRDEAHWDEASDVAGVIETLMRLAKKAGDMPTAAAMAAARGLLAEAAKLKGRREDTARTPENVPHVAPRFLPLSDEDWLVKHVPRG